MRRSFVAIAVLIPLAVLALGIVRAERHLASSRRWAFAVTGYDPRDLLRGHYIQYRVVLDETDLPPPGRANGEPCDEAVAGDCCLCLAEGEPGGPALLEWMRCETALAECEGAMQTSYLEQLRRYYIPEDRAAELTAVFQDASSEHRSLLVVAVDEAGKPQIDLLLVDGVPVEKARRATATAIPGTEDDRDR